MEETTRPTIAQLEKLLQQDDQISLTILGGEYGAKRRRFADGFTLEQMREEYRQQIWSDTCEDFIDLSERNGALMKA